MRERCSNAKSVRGAVTLRTFILMPKLQHSVRYSLQKKFGGCRVGVHLMFSRATRAYKRHSSFHCSQPFCAPFRCSWCWSYPAQGYNSATGHFWVAGPVAWNSLVSTTGHLFGTDIINVRKQVQDTSVLSFLLH